jgi:tetratricopeptide (TPR) repeat protein
MPIQAGSNKRIVLNKSVTIRAAWIGGACVLLAAVVTGAFSWCSSNRSNSQKTDSASVAVSKNAGNITINYNLPESATREAVAALEAKIKDAKSEILLTRDEVHLLAQALRDLDQRTSGIQKLPDGRTNLGGAITGTPTITIQEHEAAIAAYEKQDYVTALAHSQEAIRVHEESSKTPAAMTAGPSLGAEEISKLYYLGALSAGALKQPQVALELATKADSIFAASDYKAVKVAALSDLGKKDEARTLLQEALRADPSNERLAIVKKTTGL